MPEKVVLYQDAYGAQYEVEIPLTSKIDPEEIRKKLEMPSYIDLSYFPMQNAIVTIWLALHAPELHQLYSEAFEKRVSNKAIPVLMFGGTAVKIHCPSANGKGILARSVKDTDFIVPKKQGNDFYKLLLGMGQACGTRYTSLKTKSDMIFNAMRQGDRYRIRTINGVNEKGIPTVTVLDIFCDSISLRHKVDVKDEFEKPEENLHTIGLENLILSKAQFIMDFPKERTQELKEHNCEYRILPYSYYAANLLVLGMEEKDVKDMCAIFLDHSLGSGNEEIKVDKIRKTLEKDQKLALTVTLNLRNVAERHEILEKWMSKAETAGVIEKIQTLLKDMPRVDRKWDKPWWNTAVETPAIQ